MRLILASASPRRADLLRSAGIPFEVYPVDVDETFHIDERPEQAVARLAEAKTRRCASNHPDSVVLGADTTVVVDGQALGKPVDAADAARMLRLLSGQTHEVLTGICLSWLGRQLVGVESTRVRMVQLTEPDVAWYVASGEPLDKAGGYAIQGLASRFIDRIEGSYTNVVGLPVARVYGLLNELGCDILGNANAP